MSLINRPSCDLCAGLCDALAEYYEEDSQKEFSLCPDCVETLTEAKLIPMPTNEEVEWS